MSGLGRKVFTAGEVLTASDVNGYLMDQAVMVFDDATARSSAIGTPTEGMISYLKDTDSTDYYNGAAWASIANPGDITGVTAGTALSGGGTAGDLVLDVNLASVASSLAGTALVASGEVVNVDFAAIEIGQAQVTSVLTSSTATAYTIASSDQSTYLRFTAPAGTVTVGTATGFTAGQQVQIITEGTAWAVIPEGTAVELYGRGTAQGTAGFLAESPYDAFSIICVGSNAYRIIGNVSAV